MRVLIVAKTRQGSRACVGGITSDGHSVRLVAVDAETNDRAGMDYAVGEVWEVDFAPAEKTVPPHVENVVVHRKHRLGRKVNLVPIIEQFMPPKSGGLEVLFEGLAQVTETGALYIAERTGIPPYSTMFWRPNRPLLRSDAGKRIRYSYATPDGNRTLTFVGFQEPLETIPAGSLLRVSLAHWWRPKDAAPDAEYRCYVQLSGWFLAPEYEVSPYHPPGQPAEFSPAGAEAPWRPASPDQAEARRLLNKLAHVGDVPLPRKHLGRAYGTWTRDVGSTRH
jgi:ATP-dependent DNA helicase RecQ